MDSSTVAYGTLQRCTACVNWLNRAHYGYGAAVCSKMLCDQAVETLSLRSEVESHKSTTECYREGFNSVRRFLVDVAKADPRTVPEWSPLDDIPGMVTQLDNLYAGLRTDKVHAENITNSYKRILGVCSEGDTMLLRSGLVGSYMQLSNYLDIPYTLDESACEVMARLGELIDTLCRGKGNTV